MREAFHVPDAYFLSHSVGCLPRATETDLSQTFLTPWQTGSNWADWMGVVEQFRSKLGQHLGVPASTICPQTNISSALTKIIHSLPLNPARNVILLSKQDFPTIGFVLKQAERVGYRLRFIEGDPTDLTQWDHHIGPDTAFVHVTHALSNTSHLLPVAQICALARQAGAISIVDIAQSFIAVPTPVAQWNADFVTGTSVKFLCGGPGACFLYVSPNRLDDCKPIDVGWFSHDNPFEMDIGHFRYADDAMRFFGGTPSPAPLVCANTALDLWASHDLEAAQARIQTHLDRLAKVVPAGTLISPRDSQKRGATCVVAPNDRDALSAVLDATSIYYDMRDEGFRFSVHAYTSEDEITQLAELLSD